MYCEWCLYNPWTKIGNGVNIAANSVVTKDVPDYAFVVGSSAKVLKMKHEIDKMQLIDSTTWWN